MICLMEIRVNRMGEKFRCDFFFYFFLKIFYTICMISLLVKIFLDFFREMVYNIYINMPKPALQGAALRCPAGRRKNVDKC